MKGCITFRLMYHTIKGSTVTFIIVTTGFGSILKINMIHNIGKNRMRAKVSAIDVIYYWKKNEFSTNETC